MKKFSKAVCIIASIMLGAGILLAFIGFISGAKTSIYFDFKNGISLASQSEPFVYENYELENIDEIYIDVSNASLRIEPSDNGKFGIRVNYGSFTETPDVSTSGGRISVKEKEQHAIGILNILSLWQIFSEGNSITLYIPVSGTAELASFTFRSDNGSIVSDTPLTTSELDLKTSNGSVNISKMTVRQSALVKTSNGAIICGGAFYGSSEFKTSNGRIELSGNLSGSISLKTSNGSITVNADKPQTSYGIHADTSNGSIKINDNKLSDEYTIAAPGADSITAKTSNGSINLYFEN